MNTGKARGIITGSLVITLIIGTLNSLYKKDSLPKFRFYFGSGILYLMLSGLAEFEAEIAQNIAIAILIFTVLGEGGGTIDHFLGVGAAGSTLNTVPKNDPDVHSVDIARRDTGINATHGTAFLYPVRPVAPPNYN